ncbi:transmembrane protein, putative [Rhizoctonia solani AG-3 Rhs1AP]|uniref:Transmembrane protein, putative n=1 Tax=Rhizoctonia solani AG-3 Rhs1AP TaxID=1086054 RepID=A0A0A1UJI4_9AGAM|nr:transmembrane protein, putative [Rhizoctonia solani AG-3 Rhs1AP]
MIAYKVYSVTVQKFVDITAVASVFLGGTCSLSLLAITLSPFFTLRSHVSMRQLRRTNTKDAFQGSVAPLAFCVLSFIGHQRDISIRNPVVFGTKKFLGRLLFRRVRPVETRVYALLRNVFALIAMVVLVFRMVSALQRAQNEISTRITSSTCDRRPIPDNHDINLVLVWILPVCILRLVQLCSLSLKLAVSLQDSRMCSILASKELEYDRALDTFVCPSAKQMSVNSDAFGPQDGVPYFRLYLEVSRRHGTLDLQRDIPLIWLSNGLEQPGNLSSPHAHPVRAYMPAWMLRPGFHMDTEAKLITKRLIKSSIFKGCCSQLKTYVRLRFIISNSRVWPP